MLRPSSFAIALTCVVAASGMARADLLTANTIESPKVITFDDQGALTSVTSFVEIGDDAVGEYVFVMPGTGSASGGLYFNQDDWQLAGNGDWGRPKTYVGMKDTASVLLFQFFEGPVSAVGGFMNYPRFAGLPLAIAAYNSSKTIIESYIVTDVADIVTPGGYNAGAFRGIQRATNDITYFVVVGGPGTALDNLTFGRVGSAAPTAGIAEPGAIGLLALGLAGLAARRRLRG